MVQEVNFVGLPGPSYMHAGLPSGNRAAEENRDHASNPRLAALQSLQQMRYIHGLGVRQVLVPPHVRPELSVLRTCGFRGTDAEIVEQAGRESPNLLRACYSAWNLWVANAATVTPSGDARDGRVHVTPANMLTNLARSIEARSSGAALRWLLPERIAAHHQPLPAAGQLSDEGAANVMRLCRTHAGPGVHVFVFGKTTRMTPPRVAERWGQPGPSRYDPRQTYDASAAVARLHGLAPESVLFLRQEPAAIDAGVFHNDVIATSNQNVLLYHARAFADREASIAAIRDAVDRTCGCELIAIELGEEEVPLETAVRTYLFNSQILSMPDGGMTMLVPRECVEAPTVSAALERIVKSQGNPIVRYHPIDVSESMAGGGGPACLRLRVVLTEAEREALPGAAMITGELLDWLTEWIGRSYRSRLDPNKDIQDPELLTQGRRALRELLEHLQAPPHLMEAY